MKTGAARETKATPSGPARRTNRGVALSAPGHGMPAVALGLSRGGVGAAIGSTVAPRANTTGLPDRLKSGVEALSGLSMDDVRVHYNSPRPAQLRALAYTKGADVHVGPGQERHLPHEAWHVVQQKQGRVRATMQMKDVAINDDGGLEREADINGARAAARTQADAAASVASGAGTTSQAPVVQRKVGFEFETSIPVRSKNVFGNAYTDLKYQQPIFDATTGNWKVVADGSRMEFVTKPFNENAAGRVELGNTMTALVGWAGAIPARVTAASVAGNPGTARVDSVGPALGTTANLNFGLSPLIIRLNALADALITASPQATGGVRLDQIETLVNRMSTTQITAAAPQASGQNLQDVSGYTDVALNQAVATGRITGADRDLTVDTRDKLLAYQATANVTPQNFATSLVGMDINDAKALFDAKELAVHAVDLERGMLPNPRPDFDKLKGFLTLVLSYILVGHRQTQVYSYSKIIAPLMARTTFYAMFRLLDDNERALFTQNFVLTAAGLAGTGATRMFARGFDHRGAVERGPTRAEWIDSIIRGSPAAQNARNPTDLMSQGSGSIAAQNSSGLGSMAQADQRLTGQHDLAVLELRRLPKGVHRTEWRQMALDIFDMIVALP